ncbi:gamma-tubulin complex subunit [Angomonas deanei]|uniref:Spindle pole body component n=1 Tax=Angomonas deanei TaxID=59799 RepID=A0A7G2BZP6_9TRYP|nr:gamma-tubulin complex subunit [Angomonas deanei]CAD2212999.1 Gamma tubulin complex component N-terminal/Gamma tubulin complex component C-terminal, putative [Angomonas deanei]|eukprot:EPY40722.1 gamma-tubulin complex subunit [Angomonas deanei]
MKNLCETVLPVADAFLALQRVEKTECCSKSLVAMSLGEVVAEVSTSYAHEMTKLQRWSEDKTMPLMGVVSEVLRVGQHMVRLRQILPIDLLLSDTNATTTHNIAIQSSLLGTRILNNLSEQSTKYSGSKQDEELRSLILRRALVPYLRMLHRWMHEGILEDPFGEFFIMEAYEPSARSSQQHAISNTQRRHVLRLFPEAATTSLGTNDNDTTTSAGQQEVLAFERRFSINKRMIPSFLEKPSRVSKMIFFAGKYCCLLREYNNTLPDFGESSEGILVWADIDDLRQKIQDTFEIASNAVIQLLFSPSVDLMGHLHSLKSYFLQGRGDWVVDFLDSADALLSKATTTVKVHSIRVLLQGAIARACNTDPYHALIGCSFSNASLMSIVQKMLQEKTDAADGDGVRPSGRLSTGEISARSCVDLLQLEVDLEWPLTLVLDHNTIQKLNNIFRLLMSIKMCERRLSDIWNNNEVLSTFSSAYGIKHQLVQFFRQFLFYSAHFVLEPLWGKLLLQVGQADSIFSLSQALQEFFEKVEKGLTLSSITRFKSLSKIIDISNQLCEIGLHSSTGTTSLIEAALNSLEDSFLKTLTELASPTGADYAQLVTLFTWVDFSGFYGRNRVYTVHHGATSGLAM